MSLVVGTVLLIAMNLKLGSTVASSVLVRRQQRRHAFGMPLLLYGTAWKQADTTALVRTALRHGFAGIDTASQPKHYREDLVGEALAEYAVEDCGVPVQDLDGVWLQTKFTPIDGHDLKRPLPYDAAADIGEQVIQSFATSQRQLGVLALNALVLHAPFRSLDDTLAAWSAMSELHGGQLVDFLGISNIYDAEQFLAFFDRVAEKPRFVQNHLHHSTRHLRPLLPLLAARNVSLQLFWTLTGNGHVLNAPEFLALAATHKLTPAQLFYAFLLQRGLHAGVPVTILDGTTSAAHMRDDLAVASAAFDAALLSDDELARIRALLFQPGA